MSGWIDQRDLKRMRAQGAAGTARAHASPHASYRGITIDGDHAFIAATKRALDILARIGHSPKHLRIIRECNTGWQVGGWYFDSEKRAEFEPAVSFGDADFYASSIAHEDEHAAGHDGSGKGESHCLGVQAAILRKLGSSYAATIQEMADNPTPFHMR